MTPTAPVLPMGSLSITHDRQLPGAPVPGGYNYQTGFGLFPGFEFVGRLATNDLHCNMFASGACPPGTIRDFSASMKWQLPLPWDEKRWPSLAIGATDLGGAATYFRSYYAVATQQWRDWRFSVGKAEGQVPSAPLHGAFGSIQYSPVSWFSLSAEQIDKDRWLSAKFQPTISSANFAIKPYLYFTRSLNEPSLTDRQWLGFGVSFPLGSGVWGTLHHDRAGENNLKTIKSIAANDLEKALSERGFYQYRFGSDRGRLILRVENTAYHWNLLDAAGNALGVLIAAYGQNDQTFRVEVTQRGLTLAVLVGDMACAKRLMNEGQLCQSGEALRFLAPSEFSHNSDMQWDRKAYGFFRPELILSPSITTGVGTEFGALDIASAVNMNWIVPLWTGAYYDWNRIVPFHPIETADFGPGKAFYGLRFTPSTNRRMLHQVIAIDPVHTRVRGSYGTLYTYWDGWQIESSTDFGDGEHRLGLMNSRYVYAPYPDLVNPRDPRIASWRYAPQRFPFYHAELQAGKFWSGDKGYIFTQRFWYGDTSVALYIRRSRMSETEPRVSFAGFQIQVPLTLRSHGGLQYFGLRGTNQWSYSAESKILEKDNRLTTGYGFIPRPGDNLSQWLNRDRLGQSYLNSQLPRMREAYWSNETRE